MADCYIGEIKLFPFNWAPMDWVLCNGDTLPIQQYSELFALIGTFYGGDGIQNFKLPDLQGRVPVGLGVSTTGVTYNIGVKSGAETVTLTASQIGAHNHLVNVSTNNDTEGTPKDNYFGTIPASGSRPRKLYNDPGAATMAPNCVSTYGSQSVQAHNNVQPSLVLNYCISIAGEWPPHP
jgi:microcystin-dependent protein